MVTAIRQLRGWVSFSLEGAEIGRVLSDAAHSELMVWRVAKRGGVVQGRCYAREYHRLARLARKRHCRTRVVKRHGAPFVLNRYRWRWGVVAGAVIVVAASLILSNFVWSVEVNGNVNVTTKEILQVAKENGLTEGALKAGIDYNDIEYQLKKQFNKFAWISINENGTHITIEVSELNPKPDILKFTDPCDVVAKYDGVIQSVEPYRGKAVVKPNDFVRKGSILVSGVVEDAFEKTHYYHATAEVIAQVEHTLTLEQPFDASVTIKTGEVQKRNYLTIFGLRIPLFIGGVEGEYDTSDSYSWLSLFGKELPFGITERTFIMKQTDHLTLDEAGAKRLLTEQVQQKEAEEFADCKILAREYNFTTTETGVTLSADYTVEQDIAEQQQIYLSQQPEENPTESE